MVETWRLAVAAFALLLLASSCAGTGAADDDAFRFASYIMDPENIERYGYGLASQGDYILVRAMSEGKRDEVLVYDCANPNNCTHVASIYDRNNTRGVFGWGMAVDGRLLSVSSYGDGVDSVLMFDCPTLLTCTEGTKLYEPDPYWDSNFGMIMAMSGPLVVVAAYEGGNSSFQPGLVYTYWCDTALDCALTATLMAPRPAQSAWFGAAVAANGDLVASSSIGHDNFGSVYLFTCSRIGCTLIEELRGDVLYGLFGYALALSGSILAVSAPTYYEPWNGKVYVYSCASRQTSCEFWLSLRTASYAMALRDNLLVLEDYSAAVALAVVCDFGKRTCGNATSLMTPEKWPGTGAVTIGRSFIAGIPASYNLEPMRMAIFHAPTPPLSSFAALIAGCVVAGAFVLAIVSTLVFWRCRASRDEETVQQERPLLPSVDSIDSS